MSDTPEAPTNAKIEMITIVRKNAAGEEIERTTITNTGHEMTQVDN
jgi:hypothetical protein